MSDKPFWQQFMLKICDAVGVDPAKTSVAKIDIELIPARLPKIIVTMNVYSEKEIKPIMEIFEAAEWK